MAAELFAVCQGGMLESRSPTLADLPKSSEWMSSGRTPVALAGLTCAVILAEVNPGWEREFVGRGGLAAVESA